MTQTDRPLFETLGDVETEALLARNHVGRLAFTFRDHVDIEPINYVFVDGWIYARTSAGTKLTTLSHNPWVAFEVDEIEDAFNWHSVVVHGKIYLIDGRTTDGALHHAAVEILRTLDPTVLTDHDAVAHRDIVFRIHADKLTGRSAFMRVSSDRRGTAAS